MQKQKQKKKEDMKKYVKKNLMKKTKIMMPFQPVQPICDSTRTLPS